MKLVKSKKKLSFHCLEFPFLTECSREMVVELANRTLVKTIQAQYEEMVSLGSSSALEHLPKHAYEESPGQ